MNNHTPEKTECQAIIFKKLAEKKANNKIITEFLREEHQEDRALKIENCAMYVGVTEIGGVAKIVKADFCRDRLCNICTWRRQAKFIAQSKPILEYLKSDYEYIFVTLTIKNMPYEELQEALNTLLQGFRKLRERKKVMRAWKGIIRSVELTYVTEKNEYHPHIHCLVAVDKDYFINPDKYITSFELSDIWQKCISVEYKPVVHVEAVEDLGNASLETIKYALKPSRAKEALKAFKSVLAGRRLVSFTGIFAKTRKLMRLTDFEENLLDDINSNYTSSKTYSLYKFDVTGGIYKFYKSFELEEG